jgi:hypothetical protein
MMRLNKQHFHLAVVLVGFEEDGTSTFWDGTKEANVDAAIQVTRDMYARAGFGIGRITRWRAAPNATPTPHNMLELEIWGASSGVSLVEKHNVDSTVINAFIVPDMDEGLAGHNPHGEHGVIVKYKGSAPAMGRTLAHEIGHILISSIGWVEEAGIADPGFLDHNDDPNNLMQSGGQGFELSQWQRHNIRTNGAHDFLKQACFAPVDTSETVSERVPGPWEEPTSPGKVGGS